MEVNNNYKNKNIEKLANMFSILGDNTRLQIVTLLMHRDANVGEIASELNMTQSAISHQLRILRDAQIVKILKLEEK